MPLLSRGPCITDFRNSESQRLVVRIKREGVAFEVIISKVTNGQIHRYKLAIEGVVLLFCMAKFAAEERHLLPRTKVLFKNGDNPEKCRLCLNRHGTYSNTSSVTVSSLALHL